MDLVDWDIVWEKDDESETNKENVIFSVADFLYIKGNPSMLVY